MWQPIETYDALEKKPELALFRFAPVPPSRSGGIKLGEIFDLCRNFGLRKCTHWLPIVQPQFSDEP